MKVRTTSLSLFVLFAVASLTACSSDSDNEPLNDSAELPPVGEEGEPLGVFNPDATTDIFACEARYYTDLRGSYVGLVTYTSAIDPAETCTWDASLQVRGAPAGEGNTSACIVSATYSYTLTEGDELCADGSLTGDMDDPLADISNQSLWENPEWPYDLSMALENSIADDTIIPIGTIAADARELTFTFDGFDQTFLIDNNDSDGTVEGTFVKF